LYHYFLDAGIPEPQVSLVQSIKVNGGTKELAWSTPDATAAAIISEGIASRDELAAALASLREFTGDPTTLICDPRVFQLWSRR
jgi:hypothetical protein